MLNNSGKATLLLLTGLMMSSVAMADSGRTVQGGSGNVTLSVPVQTTTCSVSFPDTAITFHPVSKNSVAPVGTVLDNQKFDIQFQDCALDSLYIHVMASDYMKDLTSVDFGAFDSSTDPDQSLYYRILIPNVPEVTSGGILYTSGDKYFDIKNGAPLVISPGSADYTLSSKIRLVSGGKDRSNLAQTVTGGFTYLVTYN